ncbi:MAG TPA: CarD family transcriptional regulator, partial [Gemmatimonadales bacterium]|nr:CarD family transcriptional regulator [Gemmatimonadales bacterium]
MPLEFLLDRFDELPATRALADLLPPAGGRRPLGGLPGSSVAVLVATLARRLPQRLFVVVAPTPADAERWLGDLRMLRPDGVALYPQREGLGAEEPHVEIAGERLETVAALLRGQVRLLVTTARATAERTGVPAALAHARLDLAAGAGRQAALTDVVNRLAAMGFERVPTVTEVGQVSVRGGIVDVYGYGMAGPTRIEWWGDDIASLRGFDLDTQRSGEQLERVTVLPMQSERSDDPDVSLVRASLLDLLPADALVVLDQEGAVEHEVERGWTDAAHHVEVARRMGEDSPPREDLLLAPEAWRSELQRFARLVPAETGGDERFPIVPPEAIDRDLKRLRQVVRDPPATVILCDNEGQLERLDELLGDATGATLVVGALDAGFLHPALRVLTDHEIFRRARRLRRARRYRSAAAGAAARPLAPGEFVVHLDHGIGIFRGLQTVPVGEATLEVAVVEYEGGDRLNVPLYRLDQLEPYRAPGDGDAPPPRLHRLGATTWQRQRDKTRSAIRAMAQELLALYARRQLAHGYAFPTDTPWQRELESAFLYEDTPDQVRATLEVKRDMERARPMDRLLVGDVGYGKTEVALRAAF